MKEIKEELRKKREQLHREEVKDMATRLQKAYDYLLQVRGALSDAEQKIEDTMIQNLEKKIRGEAEEDLGPLRNKQAELKKKVEEAEELVRLLERKARQVDPKFFDFL